MLIKSITLENIRSYTNERVEFPSGSVLLSGDIGSGKSTILSAIEFALFGIKRGELSGGALLRHGKKQGSVELIFEIDGKEVILKRNLKRGKDEISQDSGYIITKGLKKEATAVELKTLVLELLGFPADLVSKSKDLVYRYTVYTPQEQMKQILIGDIESRLDTLRRVFGIDKYKRIKANTFTTVRQLREKISLFEGKIEDLEQKQNEKKKFKEQIDSIDIEIKTLEPELKQIKEKLNAKKTEILSLEKEIDELNKLKKELSVGDTNIKNYENQLRRNKDELARITSEIYVIKEDVKGKEVLDTDFIKKDIAKRQEDISNFEKQLNEINKSIGMLESKKQISNELKQKISKIDKCPTCLQDVNDEHKSSINQREDSLINEIDIKIKDENLKKSSIENELGILKLGLEKIRKKESEMSLIKVKLVYIDEKTKSLEKLKKENEETEKNLIVINTRIKEINEKILLLNDSEQKHKIIKKEYDEILLDERNSEIKKAEMKREKDTIIKVLSLLEEEIKNKIEAKQKLAELREKDNWLMKHFMNLVSTIEKHVMLKIHEEFNELFREWFNLLIEDETLQARLDDSFTPIVQQDGYDTEFANLSGGERTSLALAYRLSLNRVINDLITSIKIRDLIILDEPTEGFSTEQLDRVKLVIDQLNLQQTIIVSHESKMEGFVDNVIRIVKERHVSKVV